MRSLLSVLNKCISFFLLSRSVVVLGRKNNIHRPKSLSLPSSFIRIPYGGADAVTTDDAAVLSAKEGEEKEETITTPSSENTSTTTEAAATTTTDENTNDDTTTEEKNKYTFSLFQDGDGSEEDEDGIPARYIRMQKGNREKAKVALHKTLEWRKEHDVDTILSRSNTWFELCKEFQPHFFLGHDTTDHIIFVQRPGFTKFEMLPYVKPDNILLHYCYIMEYCWNILNTSTENNGGQTTMTAILDLAKVKLRSARDMLYFVRQFVSMMSHHYPQRSYKTLIINSPTWFSMIYKVIQPLLRESTKLKISILARGTKQQQLMKELLGDDIDENLLNGTEYNGWKDLPMEKELHEFCLARLRENGNETMEPIPTISSSNTSKKPKKSFFSMKKDK